ncbi:MAG: amino acid ABC transporter substrate-binding protein [Deltaproteobacteria bacterium]|nr:amino acid ABC transporter substrate-binding protein [Deltaproteobacteria bacterium]
MHRPPYYERLPDGRAAGALVEIARMVFVRAGVPHEFVEVPPRRILRMVRNGQAVCSVGWFRTPEREAFARFSEPIYQNLPMGALIRREKAPLWPERPTMRVALESGLVLGLVKGFRYGPWEERFREVRRSHTVERIETNQESLFRMLCRGRVDWMLICPEEAGYQFRVRPRLRSCSVFRRFADAPAGNRRYLMFSRAVPQEVVEAVNAAIREVVNSPEYRRIVRRLQDVDGGRP